MLLNDVMIKQLVEKDPTFIQPFEGRKVSDGELPSWGLEPYGYTFRLAPQILYYPSPFSIHMLPRGGGLHPADMCIEPYLLELDDGDYFCLPPFATLLCSSVESFHLSTNIVALIVGKSTYTRQGLFYQMGVVESGHNGVLTFMVTNLNPSKEIKVYAGAGIGQILFFQLVPAEV